MGILVDEHTRVLVQGITGKQGRFHTRLMLEYGTDVVAGVTPGKGGAEVDGIQVYNSVNAARSNNSFNASIVFVPASSAAVAVHEALDNKVELIIVISEHVPIQDSIKIMTHAHEAGSVVVGPNTPGVITPGKSKVGIMPANVFLSGNVGIVSRSGTLTYEIARGLTEKGIGQSTCVGIGGDPIGGINFVEALGLFKADSQTDAVVIVGEIGGNLEEVTAEYVIENGYPKPLVAYVAGQSAPAGKRMGHAGAIIAASAGSAKTKIDAFQKAGIRVAETPGDVAKQVTLMLRR